MECLSLGSELISFSNIVGDNDVVKDGATLHLPEVEANEAKVSKLVHFLVVDIVWVGNFLSLPDALVSGVGDTLDGPLALESWIVNHWCLTITITIITTITITITNNININITNNININNINGNSN